MPTKDRQAHHGGNRIIRYSVLAFVALIIGAYFFTNNERKAGDNAVRSGMETSQPTPLPNTAPSTREKGG